MAITRIITLSNLTLLVALALSTVAAYYSIIGLTAIFAGAVIPVIIMGTMLEIGKITTTVWLRKYWDRCSWALKCYLIPAVVVLALLTSMGIFGFLSRAHMEQGVTSGDVQAKLSLIDEKIKIQRENIELARKALTQMDNQVDARLSRGDSENSAERAVAIRRQQAGERNKLLKEINDAQQVISKLNEERAPIAAENRKVEAEVGPIKYIAALIYEDNPSNELLERAVRWVIILLVIVFDPLAIALVLAANSSKDWDAEESKDDTEVLPEPTPENTVAEPEDKEEEKEIEELPSTPETVDDNLTTATEQTPAEETVETETVKLEPITETITEPEIVKKEVEEPVVSEPENTDITTEGITKEKPYKEVEGGYVLYDGKILSYQALKELHPELFIATADHMTEINCGFGSSFPRTANKGDTFVRVDVLPNKLFKFDSKRWIEIDKKKTNSYLYNEDYLKFLIKKIDEGEYDIESMTDNEKSFIEIYLKNQKV